LADPNSFFCLVRSFKVSDLDRQTNEVEVSCFPCFLNLENMLLTLFQTEISLQKEESVLEARGIMQITDTQGEEIVPLCDTTKYKFVTPFSDYLTYCLSPLDKTSKLNQSSSRPDGTNSSNYSITGWGPSPSANVDTPVISRSSVGENSSGDTPEPEQDPVSDEVCDTPTTKTGAEIADYESSSYFPVMFHRMLTAVSTVDSKFMRWCSEGTGFVIDYSLSDETMSQIIKPFFKRKCTPSCRFFP
jgi:hypothetical protein